MSSIRGPLHAEVRGAQDAPPMVFVHPNPQDSASWMFQVAHFSTWFRCVAVDLPGYGRSPSAAPGLTMDEVAAAVWDAVDARTAGGPAVLVGCSVGSNVVQRMFHLRPGRTDAVVVTGGWRAVKEHPARRIAGYRAGGLDYRYEHVLSNFSDGFADTPLGRWLAASFVERNATADVDTIVAMFEALAAPDPDELASDLHAPVLVVSGRLDRGHDAAHALHARLPDSRMAVIDDAGHACHLEKPWEYDAHVIRFLRERGHDHLPEPRGW